MRLSVERAEMRLPVTLEVLEIAETLQSVSVWELVVLKSDDFPQVGKWVKVRMGPGKRNPGNLEIPVIWTILTVRAVQIGAPPWRSMRPVDEQEVRQVFSDRHETCTLIVQLFEIYNLAD